MFEAVSCWRVDWTAIGAVATAGTCLIALSLVGRDRLLRMEREKKLRNAVAALLEGEILDLHVAAASFRSLLTGWEAVDLGVTRKEMMVGLSPKLMTETFKSMSDLSAEVLEAIGKTISAAHQCLSLIPKLRDKDARDDPELSEAILQAIEYGEKQLQARLKDLEKCLGTNVTMASPDGP